LVLDPLGVRSLTLNNTAHELNLCCSCLHDIKKSKTPALALANRTFLGPTPSQLKDLTLIEESMIALCRAKSYIVQLSEQDSNLTSPQNQRGFHGNIIIYPQQPEKIASILPPSIEDTTSLICVIFVGSSPPSVEWLRHKARPLAVRANKIRQALTWLQKNNPLYAHVSIDYNVLNSLPENDILPFHIEHVSPKVEGDALTSRYDVMSPTSSNVLPIPDDAEIAFQKLVISDVDGHASSHQLQVAALRHVQKRGGGYLTLPHDVQPVNEFTNPKLFPMLYPTLFPYGIGGFEDQSRKQPISLKHHVKHLLNLADHRFQEHPSFIFTAFNILQRRALLFHTSLKTKRKNFPSLANMFATVSPDAVHCVLERVIQGDKKTAYNKEEHHILRLMQEVQVISKHVPGSSAARVEMRNEIRSMITQYGMPIFFLTINPADIYNPLVKFLAGSEIDIDHLLPEQVPIYWEQALLVARNPVVAARFFNIYMQAFIHQLLRYDLDDENSEGGALGSVKAYYGCVEAQGRGTLHCHMVIWIEGGLNPDEIKDRVLKDESFKCQLLHFMEDTISTNIPNDPDPMLTVAASAYHPCSIRGLNQGPRAQSSLMERQKDLFHLSKQCQCHVHKKTCYKYCKNPLEEKECRFGLDESKFQPVSMVDSKTGEIDLKCLDGMVNDFNETILIAIRCNMDIKFIGSGEAAKAILYYITDYISKAQLKAHVAYAALELAVRKLGEYNCEDDEKTVRAKRMLQKCAHAMISQQELSAQQVVSYLLDYEDHFTSHNFNRLFWTAFEAHINNEIPSPECENKHSSNLNAKEEEEENDNEKNIDDNYPIDEVMPTCTSSLLNEHNIETDQSHSIDQDEVAISVDENNEIKAHSSQLTDYTCRGRPLDNMPLWDFCAQGLKVKSDTNKKENKTDFDINEMLACSTKTRPLYKFTSSHEEYKTHAFKIIQPSLRRIPVLVGSVPRRDQEDSYARYCRLMLILFKPWRTAFDLRQSHESWIMAFENFKSGPPCPNEFKRIMDNMQLLHECKDNRNNHFYQRQSRHQQLQREPELTENSQNGDFINISVEDIDDTEILMHLESIENCYSERRSLTNVNTLDCVTHAETVGLFNVKQYDPQYTNNDLIHKQPELADPSSDLENNWKSDYEQRRSRWKQRASIPVQANVLTASNITMAINDDSNLLEATGLQPLTMLMPSVQLQSHQNEMAPIIEIKDLCHKWTLNPEQSQAFKIITEHSLHPQNEPLRMFISGPAGTGKTRVINAVTDFFEQRKQMRRFRLASYMGISARHISGMTLHSALSLSTQRNMKTNSKSHQDLIAMWEGVEYLFIDEVSMISCQFLYRISEALCIAKGNTNAFGSINIIFAGDFAQLPPVKETRLYSRINTRQQEATTHRQKTVFGKLLWLSVSTIIILHHVQRQTGIENQNFVELLTRLREGRCTEFDYDLLNGRMLEYNINIDFTNEPWRHAPIIVYDNAAKDALNICATVAFAKQTGQELYWYYAEDKHHKKKIKDQQLIDHLIHLPSGQTGQRLGRIPLVLGMPILVSQNFDVEGGVVNGSKGTITQIRYHIDEENHRYLNSVVIHIPDSSDEKMGLLPPHHLPILPDSTDIVFEHPYSNQKCHIQRTQVPILPAFAMTAHRAQGQTLERVIIDLQSCKGTEAPYVMASRAQTLNGLLILRPFEKKKICCRESEDARKEKERLKILNLLTLTQLGSDSERMMALEEMKEIHKTKDNIQELIPPACKSTTKYSSAQQTLELHQTLISQHTSTTNIVINKKRPLENIMDDDGDLEKTQPIDNEINKGPQNSPCLKPQPFFSPNHPQKMSSKRQRHQ